MFSEKIKLAWHKWTHWEYWPVQVVYAPTIFLWGWYVIRFRSFRFFKYSNPVLENGGLFEISKMSIYKLLPTELYPTTVLIQPEEKNDFARILENRKLEFPLIVKPDKGYRGIGVKKVFSVSDIKEYASEIQQPFLLQEVSTHPNEVSIFYCREPQNSEGKITGITTKKFLTVKGDGKSKLEELLRQKPRFKMQIEKLRTQVDLSEILKSGEKRCLVPFGNHNRGTEFGNGNQWITPKLNATFDKFLSKIDGFNYGRLDVRFNTIEELAEGKNFSIIELNGALSEPTHIYDTRTNFWQGQKEIFRHQRIFGRIVAQNKRLHKTLA